MTTRALLIFLFSLASLHAQSPQYLIGAGMGFNSAAQPQANGWMNFGVKVSDAMYTTTAIDISGKTSTSPGKTTVRAGFERILYQGAGYTLTTKGDAGMITTSDGNLGAAFGAGGSLLYDISKWLKVPGSYLAGSVTVLKTSVDAVQPVFRFGFVKTFGQ